MAAAHIIHPVRTAEDLRTTAVLFADYARSLPINLAYQDFSTELATLPGKYAPPKGELLLARDLAGEPLGCVGLRPMSQVDCCEMKRLFVAPEARGHGLGRALADSVIQVARITGYREMRLDTLATMTAAIAMYEQIGFQRIAPYYAPTPQGTIFMRLNLYDARRP